MPYVFEHLDLIKELVTKPSFGLITDVDGTISHYQLQISTSADFSTIQQEWNATTTTFDVSGLTDGTYYFRVRAFDNDDAASAWSNDESIVVEISTPTTPPPLPIDPALIGMIVGGVVIAVIVIGVVYYFIRKRQPS